MSLSRKDREVSDPVVPDPRCICRRDLASDSAAGSSAGRMALPSASTAVSPEQLQTDG